MVTDSSGATTSVEPDEGHRWRCSACGNLTRFDVVRRATVREYWHLDLAGEPVVEETETLTSTLVSLACRWCGRTDSVQVVPRPGTTGA